MFNQKETVLYKGKLCEVVGIEESIKWGQCYHLKTIYEKSPWTIQVPYENAFQNIRKLPTKDEVNRALVDAMYADSMVIERNSVDRICKPLLDSHVVRDWLILLRELLNHQAVVEATGKKFLLKEQDYLNRVSEQLIPLYSYVLDMNEEDTRILLFETFMDACI